MSANLGAGRPRPSKRTGLNHGVAMSPPGSIRRVEHLSAYTTDRCRAMQVVSTSTIGFSHQSPEKISISA